MLNLTAFSSEHNANFALQRTKSKVSESLATC
jgi:hypothetical protein